MYTLYGFPQTRSLRVLWALEELGVEYDYQVINLRKFEQKSEEYLAISPAGKVPLLKSDDGVLSESAAILAYLANKHGAPLMPKDADALQYGKVAEMNIFIACELEQPLWNIAKHSFILPEEKRVEQVKATAKWEYEQALAIFSKMLGDREFAAGDAFSFADIMAIHTLNWAKGIKLDSQFDNVNDYRKRVMQRPAFGTAMTKEKEALAKLE